MAEISSVGLSAQTTLPTDSIPKTLSTGVGRVHSSDGYRSDSISVGDSNSPQTMTTLTATEAKTLGLQAGDQVPVSEV